MKSVLVILAILFAASYAKFSLSCTVECAAYWTCHARAAWSEQAPNCKYPSGCECKKPYWSKDDVTESDKTLREVKQKLAFTESDFSMKCTIDCGKYYVCKAKGAWNGDYSSCVSPAGCECKKFAWEKDISEADAEFFDRVTRFAKKNADQIESDQLLEKLRSWINEKVTKIKNTLQKKTDDEEEADQLFEKIRSWVNKKKPSLKDLFQKKTDDEEEADQFFDKFRSWINEKVDKIKNTFQKKTDDEEEADQFFDKLRSWINERMTKLKKTFQKKADYETESDAEAVNCGVAYERGRAIGSKMCVHINGKLVVEATAAAFNRMKAAASKAGVSLTINSGFRTQKEQQYFYNCYLTKKCNNGNLAAKPGYSNHQNGKALDISVVNSKVYNWLSKNASKYGFVRTVPSEKWHWELRNTRCNAFVSYSCN